MMENLTDEIYDAALTIITEVSTAWANEGCDSHVSVVQS